MTVTGRTVRAVHDGSFFRSLARCRLCWRIAVAVFVTILAIEAAVVLITARSYEHDHLAEIEARGLAAMASLFTAGGGGAERVLASAHDLARTTPVAGGAVYQGDGRLVGTFGEAPDLTLPAALAAGPTASQRSGDGVRHEVLWRPSQIGAPFTVIGRLDSEGVGRQVNAHVWRAAGLALLVSLLITGTAVAVFGNVVLVPLLRLRARLNPGDDAAAPRSDPAVRRNDELGEVVSAVDELCDRHAEDLDEVRRREDALRRANEDLVRDVQARTEELAQAANALRRETAERRKAEEEVDRLSSLRADTLDPVMRVDADGALISANPSSAPILAHWKIAVGGRLPPPWAGMAATVRRSGTAAEHEIDVDEASFSLVFRPDGNGAAVTIFGRDVTARKKAEERIRHLANHDPLTGLPNRNLFRDRLEQTLRQVKRSRGLAAVHLVDLDHFKDVNETLGHSVGDALLQGIAERLSKCVRETDTVARLGGDEFAIIQVGASDADGVATLAQKALDALARPFEIGGHQIHSNASIGVTVFPHDAVEPDQILRNVDIALYRAKDEGRGVYRFFISDMNEVVQRHKAIERDLRLALERDEFLLYYQPKLDLASGRISGMEALIRWQHPEQGFLSPALFIPVAEKTKLIVGVGTWALRAACIQNKAWQDAGLPPAKVAVNLSAVQFREPGVVDLVRRTLDETGLAPQWLELEITEGVAMENAEAAIKLFGKFADLGVSISIDDFGTGYSSLSYLKNFPVHRVKIDKAFVDDIRADGNRGAIATAVTTLGHSFGMAVTAEGVETGEQLEFLRKLTVDEIQGYLFSKPLVAADFATFLRKVNGTAAG